MHLSRSDRPISGSILRRAASMPKSSHVAQRRYVFDYQSRQRYSSQSSQTTQRDLGQLRRRLLSLILENQRRREVSERRGLSSRLRDKVNDPTAIDLKKDWPKDG